MEGIEFRAIGKDLDVLGLLLVDEFVVVAEGEVGIEIGAVVKLKGPEVVVELFVVVASNHLGQLVGVPIPLLFVVLAHLHPLVQTAHGVLAAYRPRQVQELQAPLLLSVERDRTPQLPNLGAQVPAVRYVKHSQTLALSQRHPKFLRQGVI